MNAAIVQIRRNAFGCRYEDYLSNRSRRVPVFFEIITGVLLTGAFAAFATMVVAAPIQPGHLLVTRSVYQGTGSIITIGQTLPGGGTAVADGSYPFVWENEGPDPSFGVTSPIFIDELTTAGALVGTIVVGPDQLVTSFSSKSELALNLSPDGTLLTFMGYRSPINALDVSNSNTPGHVDSTNPVGFSAQRAVAQIDLSANLSVTPLNAYSGNNGRAAIEANGLYYTVGNAGNGSGTQPVNIVNNTGVQLATPGGIADTTVVGIPRGTPGTANGFQFGFSVVDVGAMPDKSGKDDNFRGIAIFNNTLFVTKGSGSNGVNTVYQVGAAGTLPTVATAAATPITILPGFPNTLARNPGPRFPFAVWFANANTLYVADEGSGSASVAATDSMSGLQKWTRFGDTWQLAYTLQNGLDLGVPYGVPNGPNGEVYPVALSPAADGLRNLAGTVNGDGTVTIYAVTSTVSASVDQGADPNKLVAITDNLSFANAAQAAGERFTTLKAAQYGEVLRGVALAGPFGVTASVAPYNNSLGGHIQKLVVRNTSSTSVAGPIVVVLDNLNSGATLTNANGTTTNLPPLGSPYVVVPGTANGLAPGASAIVGLQFKDSIGTPLTYMTRVLNGAVSP
jgi:hypothetical protein